MIDLKVLGDPPDTIGELVSFKIVFPESEDSPSANVTSVIVQVYCDKTGVVLDEDPSRCTETAPGEWTYVASSQIAAGGMWAWKIIAYGSLVGAGRLSTIIQDDPFGPIPTP